MVGSGIGAGAETMTGSTRGTGRGAGNETVSIGPGTDSGILSVGVPGRRTRGRFPGPRPFPVRRSISSMVVSESPIGDGHRIEDQTNSRARIEAGLRGNGTSKTSGDDGPGRGGERGGLRGSHSTGSGGGGGGRGRGSHVSQSVGCVGGSYGSVGKSPGGPGQLGPGGGIVGPVPGIVVGPGGGAVGGAVGATPARIIRPAVMTSRSRTRVPSGETQPVRRCRYPASSPACSAARCSAV